MLHTNGIHIVHIMFCRCSTAIPWHVQLLRIGWFPATPIKPQTCATMECLRQFQYLNLQGKLTAYSYYRSLEYMTDSTGLNLPPVCISHCLSSTLLIQRVQDRLAQFILMAREWRHLKMCKRAGRAYAIGGIATSPPGSLAIPCRACPHPGRNLPARWDCVPPDKR